MEVAQHLQISSKTAIKSLWIHERYLILNESPNIHKKAESLDNLIKWRKRKNIVSDHSFNIKLDYENYNPEVFNYIIGSVESDDEEKLAAYVEKSKWFKVVNESLELLEKDSYIPTNPDLDSAARPFLLWSHQKLNNMFDSIQENLFVDHKTIVNRLLESLGTELINLLSRSAVLELHIAKLEGKLSGDSPEDRYSSFIKYQFLDKEKLVDFYEEYIVLTRLLATRSIYFVDNIVEAVYRFIQDFNEIKNMIDIKDSKVKEISPGRGDTHQKGHTVISFQFDNNNKVFYKPKNLFIAKTYNHFIQWINEQNELLDMSTYKIICKDSYTWEEAVLRRECKSVAEVERFYERFGQLIGITYLLRGGDFHYENVIANGEYPSIIDLETIFQHVPPMEFPDSAYVESKKEYVNSVMWLGLLPNIHEKIGMDMSALNGREQKANYKILQPQNQKTDEMKYDYANFSITNKENLPTLKGEPVSFHDYKKYIYKGFNNACMFFIRHREELLSNQELLPSFKGKPVRSILRATSRYAMMLKEGTHPDYLRDGLDRERLLENLWSYAFPKKQVVSHEVKDMLEGDIPIFFTTTEETNVISSRNEIIQDFYEKCSYDLVIERIQSLSKKEMEKQLSYIKASLGDYVFSNAKNTKPYLFENKLNHNELIKEACDIGNTLLDKAIFSKDNKTITWLDVIVNPKNIYSIDSLSIDFYDGLAGLLLFYDQLYNLTKKEKYKDVYQKILTSFKFMPDTGIVSSHYGNFSILQALSRISNHDKQTLKLVDEQLTSLQDKLKEFEYLDYLSGMAGMINCLIKLYQSNKHNNPLLEQLILKLTDTMLQKLSDSRLDNIPCGMAHGASGLSFILFKVNSIFPNETYQKMAIQLLEIDRSYFNSNVQAWEENGKYLHQWCHGSTGIGISRSLISVYYMDEYLADEMKRATQCVLENGFKLDDSLCHGNMGDIELFLTLSQVLKEEKYRDYALEILYQLLKEKEKNGKYNIRNLEGFTGVGLFTGVAGVGFEMLRVADPTIVPSALY